MVDRGHPPSAGSTLGARRQVLRVIANGTLHGEPTLPSIDLEFEQQGSLWIAEFVFTHLPESPHTVWFDEAGMAVLAAKGYTRRDVALIEAFESSKELDLTPGWGGPVYATHADTEEPLAGVRVQFGGTRVDVTDKAGKIQIEVDAAPERVEFDLDGYEVVRQGRWVDCTGEVIEVGLDSIRQYIGVRMLER